MKESLVEVGILSGKEIRFVLLTPYSCGHKVCEGAQLAVYSDGKICWDGELFDELLFLSGEGENALFELSDVIIGVNFHWERKEDQVFPGSLKLITEGDKLTAVNVVPVETYLTSVISSEMSAEASLELLKAHAVISRSWLLNIISNGKEEKAREHDSTSILMSSGVLSEHIVWYDHQAHSHYHVCADDHCQRYQGMTRASGIKTREAIRDTFGQVLMWEGRICDARFSKCCGGVLEEFRYCWEDRDISYLQAFRDHEFSCGLPNLTREAEAIAWICSAPDAFCNTTDKDILSQVLNNYDRETTDFYRWKVRYTQQELSELVYRRSGVDFGTVLDLQPVERGKSGRLVRLRIVGTKHTQIVGKELEIRRTLSPSHLYSSAFVVDREEGDFILIGAGWGHGVGLCQIGAAVMGEKGYTYDKILLHYYVGASIEKVYEE